MKLCGFKLARAMRPHAQPCSREIVTLWYRPPEILLGAMEYSWHLDMWCVGAQRVAWHFAGANHSVSAPVSARAHLSPHATRRSTGCVLAEMALGRALCVCDSEFDLIVKQFRICGTPTPETCREIVRLPEFNLQFPKWCVLRGRCAACYCALNFSSKRVHRGFERAQGRTIRDGGDPRPEPAPCPGGVRCAGSHAAD